MYICMDDEFCAGTGNTLDTAYHNYQNQYGNTSVENLTFFEASKIKVEYAVKRAQTLTKSLTNG